MAVAYQNRKHRLLLERGPGAARAYEAWSGMRRRVRNPVGKNACYVGVSVCSRWGDFEVFLSDMGEPPVGMSIDRIDTNGDYEPSNCRWADATMQSRNRNYVKMSENDAGDIRWLYTQGLSQQKLADEYGVSQALVSQIIREVLWT